MLIATTVNSTKDLEQIHELNQRNLKTNLSPAEQGAEGFVSWLYSMELLEQMHRLAASIVVKEGDKVVAYALATLKESRSFHADLDKMFLFLEPVLYKDKPLSKCNYYCMGQICVSAGYRGKGIVPMLYGKHREVYGGQFEFLLTEISTSNPRSQKAHEKTGFKTIHTYRDQNDEWNVVVWDWH
ncbi:MAG TPA: GNAT family N-acetyltransferase [Flavisolibacter sp.]|nr:GNAT family N-acetyltransferase [Flavisolibacter sp.]